MKKGGNMLGESPCILLSVYCYTVKQLSLFFSFPIYLIEHGLRIYFKYVYLPIQYFNFNSILNAVSEISQI